MSDPAAGERTAAISRAAQAIAHWAATGRMLTPKHEAEELAVTLRAVAAPGGGEAAPRVPGASQDDQRDALIPLLHHASQYARQCGQMRMQPKWSEWLDSNTSFWVAAPRGEAGGPSEDDGGPCSVCKPVTPGETPGAAEGRTEADKFALSSYVEGLATDYKIPAQKLWAIVGMERKIAAFASVGAAPAASGAPETDDAIQQEIVTLVEHGNLTLGMTEDGDVGVWLWDQDVARDGAFCADCNAEEALYGAALKFLHPESASVPSPVAPPGEEETR